MALENIVKGLRTADENPVVNPNYNSKTLTSTNEYIGNLEQVDTRTQEGLKSYKKLTGLPTRNVSPEKTALFHKQIHADVTEGFGKYISKHIEPITSELNELVKSNIGYSFCPEVESKNKKYNAVRDTVYTAKETIKTIEENPEAHINQQVSVAQDFMKGIIARFPDEVCQRDAQDAQRKAFRAIGEYDSTKFVVETHRHLEALKTAYITDAKALSEKEKETRENAPPYLDTDQSVKYFAKIETAKAELEKKAKQFEALPQLTGTIVQEAIKTIQEKENVSEDVSN